MTRNLYIFISFFFYSTFFFSQENSININAILKTENNSVLIQQEIIFYNKSNDTLKNIFLHNWANSYKSRKTPLSKRFIEDFRKDMYFAKKEDLGFSKIKNISTNFNHTQFNEVINKPDIIKLFLKKPLLPKESININLTYTVKLPNAKFTGYGKTKSGYYLRYWYITPAVYKNGWQLMSNLNLDDLYEDLSNFNINFKVPNSLTLTGSLEQTIKVKKEKNLEYHLTGKHKKDIILNLQKKTDYISFKTKHHTIKTNVLNNDLNLKLTKNIIQRELRFLEKHLGKISNNYIFIDKTNQQKDPVYGLSQLPSFIRPFSDTFKYDITMFKALTRKLLEESILLNLRKDSWLLDGIQNYLMIEYVNTFYPEINLLGKASNSWFLKRFNISKLKFNEKYPFIYQFTARKFLDQPLSTPLDSLSNFNRKIVNKYKAGLGLKYLKGYLGSNILNKSVRQFYKKYNSILVSSNSFKNILAKNTQKNIDWFFDDYLKTNKKIDYTISKVITEKDSFKVTIKNKRNITAPVALYGIKNNQIKFKKWIPNIKNKKTVNIPKGDFKQIVLNFENIYPEYNTLDNWYTVKKKIFNKPLKFTFIKDIKAPNYNQLFYQPQFSYNYYDGLSLGLKIDNKPLIKRNLEFKFSPAYATKSKIINGSFSLKFNQFYEKTKIYKITYGLAGSTQQYAPNLSYSSLIPYIDVSFKRKSLRHSNSEFLRAKLIHINKEVALNKVKTEQDNYNVFSLSYNYIFPDIIKENRYSFKTEFSKNFSKISADIRFRKLTSSDTQLDFRIFAGTFIHNKSTGNYFSFGLDRANDYLFELNYFGRSEDSGIFSQQYIIAEGGFKSVLPTRFANQYMLSLNSSIGLWRWIEYYNDVAFLKNKNKKLFFGYENGIRFNFIHNILEVYFPLYSNNGWEISQKAYPKKIRFTLTGNINSIYNFFRRGFF